MSELIPSETNEAAASRQCPECGLILQTGTSSGHCPKCLLLGVPDSDLDSSPDSLLTVPTPSPKPSAGASSAVPDWQPPTAAELAEMLPQYEVEYLLGRGGMGAVYKGRQTQLDRLVAIKILPPDLDGGGHDFTSRFKLEARSMARLKHPSIVTVYDFGQTAEGLLYFVMEFVEGMDVQAMIAQEGRLRSADAIAIAAHVCEALHYAHSHGIIHRDIKPANVIVGHDGHVRVADFGLVKVMNAAQTSHLTLSGSVMGTPNYLAPESLTLGMSVDHRVDIYAVGVMLYHMLTGNVPRGMFELPSQKVPGLDPRLDRIIARAMKEERDQRYQSAEDLRSELVSILTQPVPQTVVVSASAASSRSAPRRTVVTSRPQPVEEEEPDYDEIDPAVEAMLRSTNSMNNTLLILGTTALLIVGALAFFLANRKTGDVFNTQQTITTSTTNNSYFTQIIATGATTAEELKAIAEIRPYGDRFIGITRTALSWSQMQEIARRTGAQIMAVDEGPEREKQITWLEESYSTHTSAAWVLEKGEARIVKGRDILPGTDLETPQKALFEWRNTQSTGSTTTTTVVAPDMPPPAPTEPEKKPTIHAWTSRDGRVIQAEFIELSGESVVIKTEDGKPYTVPFTNLSPASIELAHKLSTQPK